MQAARVKKFSREEAAAKLPVQLEVAIRRARDGAECAREQNQKRGGGDDPPQEGFASGHRGLPGGAHVSVYLPLRMG